MPKTLVILPGWGSDPRRWQPLIKQLKSSLRLVLPSLPQNQVRNTVAFADWLNQKTKSLPPFFLLGHSFGGQVAINFTARYPERVKKLILVASAGIRRPSLKALIVLPLAKIFKYLPLKLKQLGYKVIKETDYIKASPVMKETMKLILQDDQQENMKKIRVSTLILWGKQDRYTPLRDGRLTKQLIKNSVLVEFNGKHSLPFSHSAEVSQKILWFIGRK